MGSISTGSVLTQLVGEDILRKPSIVPVVVIVHTVSLGITCY